MKPDRERAPRPGAPAAASSVSWSQTSGPSHGWLGRAAAALVGQPPRMVAGGRADPVRDEPGRLAQLGRGSGRRAAGRWAAAIAVGNAVRGEHQRDLLASDGRQRLDRAHGGVGERLDEARVVEEVPQLCRSPVRPGRPRPGPARYRLGTGGSWNRSRRRRSRTPAPGVLRPRPSPPPCLSGTAPSSGFPSRPAGQGRPSRSPCRSRRAGPGTAG